MYSRELRSLAKWLRENPQNPPVFAKPGRDYIISEADFSRIYEAMKRCRSSSSATRNGRPNWYLRGTVRGVHIFETTKTDDRKPPRPSGSSGKPKSSTVLSLAQARQSRSRKPPASYLEQGGEAGLSAGSNLNRQVVRTDWSLPRHGARRNRPREGRRGGN
jgi:hypothetical protein